MLQIWENSCVNIPIGTIWSSILMGRLFHFWEIEAQQSLERSEHALVDIPSSGDFKSVGYQGASRTQIKTHIENPFIWYPSFRLASYPQCQFSIGFHASHFPMMKFTTGRDRQATVWVEKIVCRPLFQAKTTFQFFTKSPMTFYCLILLLSLKKIVKVAFLTIF